MGKIILLAILLGGGYYGWQTYGPGSAAFQKYKEFSEAWRRGDCGRLRMTSAEEAHAKVQAYCNPRGFGGSRAGMAAEMAGSTAYAQMHPIYKLESESSSAGTTKLKVLLRIAVRKSNVGGNFSPPAQRHEASVKKVNGEWKVIAWERELVKKSKS